MDKRYEISVWNDTYDNENNRYTEEKLAVIGSDTMTAQDRALESKLVENINGTNTLTFKMFYGYIDITTGEYHKNQFIDFLVNERRIKVLWKNKWYEMIIKNIKEDSQTHTITYTCQDLYLNELSRTGFNLEFATELANNIDTAPTLVERTLEGTDWRYSDERSDKIYQETEEPVYEVTTLRNFSAQMAPSNESKTILASRSILVYYSSVSDPDNLSSFCQFYYTTDDHWQQEEGDMVVVNGNCYGVNVTWLKTEAALVAQVNGQPIFSISLAATLSTNYRAKRYVRSQKTIYSPIVDRYVNIYNYNGGTENLYGYQSTNYNDVFSVINILANSNDFKNTNGWIKTSTNENENIHFKLSPGFDENTEVSTYEAVSYLYLPAGWVFNTGLQNNRQYTPNGFSIGEKYVCRIAAKEAAIEPADANWIDTPEICQPYIQGRDNDYGPAGDQYFECIATEVVEDADEITWLEYTMQCIKSVSYEDILSTMNPFGFFINTENPIWIKEIQFFKYIEDDEDTRINPNQFGARGVVQPVWKYFLKDSPATSEKDLEAWIYQEPWSEAEPVYTDFEKIATIEESQSNRFNILQSIAEKFECWVRFEIEHDDNGFIIYDDSGAPCKWVYLKKEYGEESSVGFIYGIDLKTIGRTVVSDQISTKTIVQSNENQFGKNGFCTIARSSQNYPRETFIYNFDYYINQGMLNRDIVYKDLFDPNGGLGYYTHLHNINTLYEDNLEIIVNKKTELTKQQATLTVYNQYLTSAIDERTKILDDLMKLANVSSIDEAKSYILANPNNIKVKTLINDYGSVGQTIRIYQDLFTSLQASVISLQEYIDNLQVQQDTYIDELNEWNTIFQKKYGRFIQEGTWTSEEYFNDDLYYLDALQVAYTSSRPRITYDINVLRLSDLEEYKAKVFKLGDISYIQDVKFFGYMDDGITPYKEKVLISEITSNFDSPEKDVLKIQNFKTQFDDLFQRISAATQNLEFSAGKYAKAANIINVDGTIKSSVLQNTFDSNIDLVQSAVNDSVVTDNTGITVTDNEDASKRVKVTSGGIFISADGGATWNNAIRGDGITADAVTTGRLNTENITIYGADSPSFTWDQYGINAYAIENGETDLTQFVRFDKFGIYGIEGQENYRPTSEAQIYNDAKFGLTWNKFFMKSKNTSGGVERSIEISSDTDIVVKEGNINRVVIGRIDPITNPSNYGIVVKNSSNEEIFVSDQYGSTIAGWQLGRESGYGYIKGIGSISESGREQSIEMRSNGTIGSFGSEDHINYDNAYYMHPATTITDVELVKDPTQTRTFTTADDVYIFSNEIGTLIVTESTNEAPDPERPMASWDPDKPSKQLGILFFNYNNQTYKLSNVTLDYTDYMMVGTPTSINSGTTEAPVYNTVYTYTYKCNLIYNNTVIFTNLNSTIESSTQPRYVKGGSFMWSINSDGSAVFNDMTATYGNIAGWFFDNEKLYRTSDGQRDGPIIAQINSQGASIDGYNYDIITDAIKSAVASVSQLNMGDLNLTASWFASLVSAVQNANNKANQAQSTANSAYTKAVEAYNHLPSHYHKVSVAVSGTTDDGVGVSLARSWYFTSTEGS